MSRRTVGTAMIAVILLATTRLHARGAAGLLEQPGRELLRAAPSEVGRPLLDSESSSRPPFQTQATVLLVDDDWDYDYTHPGSLGGLPYYTSALDLLGISWDVWDVQGDGQPTGDLLAGHEVVIWFTGYAYGGLPQDPGVFTADNESVVAGYLDAGGNLILSSQEYYFDCCDNGPLTDFMKAYLGLLDILEDATATATTGVPGNPIGEGLGPYRLARPDDYGVYWPEGIFEGPYDDEVIPRPIAGTPFAYASPWSTGFGATNREGAEFKTLYLAWPLEWIDNAGERVQILGHALWWMGVSLPVPPDPVLQPIDNADGNAEYLVDWSDATGATEYLLEEDSDLAFPSPATRYHGPVSQFWAAQQEIGSWYYRVRAASPAGGSGWSNTGQVTVTLSAPLPPLLLPIDNPGNSGDFTVDWGDVSGATGYTLEEDEFASFYSPEVMYAGLESSAQVALNPGGTWYFRVRVATVGGTSGWSNAESVDVVPLPPEIYTIYNPQGDGDYWVAWDAPASATSYVLQEDNDPAFPHPTLLYSGEGRSYHVTGRPVGPWYYRAQASNGFGSGDWGPARSTGVFSGAPVLEPIENADADLSYLLVWSSVAGASGYRLEEDGSPTFSSPAVRYEGENTTFAVVGQLRGTWHYRVRATNPGGVSPYSNVELVGLGLYLPAALCSR